MALSEKQRASLNAAVEEGLRHPELAMWLANLKRLTGHNSRLRRLREKVEKQNWHDTEGA